MPTGRKEMDKTKSKASSRACQVIEGLQGKNPSVVFVSEKVKINSFGFHPLSEMRGIKWRYEGFEKLMEYIYRDFPIYYFGTLLCLHEET